MRIANWLLMALLAHGRLLAASDILVTPMGLPCDGHQVGGCTREQDGGYLTQARSSAPVVMFELTYRDKSGNLKTARQAVTNDLPGSLVFAAFRVGMYAIGGASGNQFVSLSVHDMTVMASHTVRE